MARTNEKVGLTLDLRGVDMVTPVDLLSDGRTPWAKNFRLYAEQADDRQVAVSSRKGPGLYSLPTTESINIDNSSGGDGFAEVGVINNILAQSLIFSTAGRFNRFDFEASRLGDSSGPIIVSVYTDDDDNPGSLITQSSVLGSAITDTPALVTARFVNAPLVDDGTKLWVVLSVQDDGSGTYKVGTDSLLTGAKYSETSFAALEDEDYAVVSRAYIAPNGSFKGSFRFNKESGVNTTLAVFDTVLYKFNTSTKAWDSVATGLSSNARDYSWAVMDGKVFWVNGYDDLKAWDGTTVETITDTELPILSILISHKDRLFGVAANDKNRLVWCEAPGNPSTEPANKQWYYAWESTSFWYIPAPKSASPITGLVSFQDSLHVFTQDNKYVFSGYDKGSFFNRQATGSKGALSMRGIASNENFIYFVADDGLYEYNGSDDKNLSERRIQPLFNACPNKNDITPVIWDNKVRWYMASQGSAINDMCVLYNSGMDGEWEIDTETYVDTALKYDDADDNSELIEFSSQYPIAYMAEQDYNSLGAPIDFEYRFKYDSFGLPAQKKRIRRYYPILQGVDSSFKLKLMMDKDFQDSPRTKDIQLTVNGSQIGNFNIGDGTTLGGNTSFKHHRQTYSGSAYYWQLRIARKAVNNRVAFIGAQYKYRIKRM